MKVFHAIAEFHNYRRKIGTDAVTPFVPTMGALHDGHASLVRQAKSMTRQNTGDSVFASIFVNPTQFGPGEDFAKYPRQLDADLAIFQAAGCDAVFVPSAQEMYPGIQELSTRHSMLKTSIDSGPLGNILDGAIRPGHFRGVCTVVAKLLHVVEPSHLLLGQKDFQQHAILRQMCRDLNFAVEVIACPTLREADGLAMSSRNRYLTADERTRAVALYEALTRARQSYLNGERRGPHLEESMHQRLIARGLVPQYAVVCDAYSLTPLLTLPEDTKAHPAVLLIAAKLGTTRLIDNILL